MKILLLKGMPDTDPFVDDSPATVAAAVLSRALAARGHDVVTAAPGGEFDRAGDGRHPVRVGVDRLRIGWGADGEEVRAGPIVPLDGSEGKRDPGRLVFAGSFAPRDGLDLLLEAYGALRTRLPDLRLEVFEEPSTESESMYTAEEVERFAPGITVRPAADLLRLSAAYKNSVLAVVPRRREEASEFSLINARATGCPVVAFDVGSVRDFILHRDDGYLVAEVSVGALAGALETLLSDPPACLRMAERIRQGVDRGGEWRRAVDALEAILKRVESDKPRFPKIALVSTWNQECGLATYAGYLTAEFPRDSLVVLAEQIDGPTVRPDEEFVTRCWRRSPGSGDYIALRDAIRASRAEVVYLNCHHRFFEQPSFNAVLEEARSDGKLIVLHLHSIFSFDERLRVFVGAVDLVIVHSPEIRLEVIAHGASPERVAVLTHGVDVRDEARPRGAELRRRLGLPIDEKIILSFGFLQPHKGMEGVIDSVRHLRERGVRAHGVIAGGARRDMPGSVEYLDALKQASRALGLASAITFTEQFHPDEEVMDYLAAADVVLMNYRSQYFEASGACSLAIGAGAIVAASLAPPLMAFGDSVWHLTAGFPVPESVELLLSDRALREELRRRGDAYRAEHCWTRTVEKLAKLLVPLLPDRTAVETPIRSAANDHQDMMEDSVNAMNNQGSPSQSRSPLRVLFQNRSNTFTQRGGDTVLVEQLQRLLVARGVEVVVDVQGKEDPRNFSLVHLFNFAIPDMVRALGERALMAGVPFVVTSLYEEIADFHNQSHEVSNRLMEYVRQGQSRTWFEANQVNLANVRRQSPFDNHWASANAAAVIASGPSEAAAIRRDFPGTKHLETVKFGHEVGAVGDRTLFEREFGVSDFILCVGRLETRKNQLMLLKALEQIDLPVVLAGGGFTYQPEFERAVREFKRRGRTIVTGRLSPEMLASAYAACRVHVLPSWYELPGLVSLEAAAAGKNVVATRRGTGPDYLGDHAFYCDPADEASILHMTLAAYYSPASPTFARHAASFTWEEYGNETVALYRRVLESAQARPLPTTPAAPSPSASLSSGINATLQDLSLRNLGTLKLGVAPVSPSPVTPEIVGASASAPSGSPSNVDAAVLRAEGLAREMKLDEALEELRTVEAHGGDNLKLLKVKGTIHLAKGENTASKAIFERALRQDPTDGRILAGLGMCAAALGEYEAGYDYMARALEREPMHLASLHQLIGLAYRLGKFDALEGALRRYLAQKPDDHEFRYCLAGCLYKAGQASAAQREVEAVLKEKPSHAGALELKKILQGESLESRPANGNGAGATGVHGTNGAAASKTANGHTPKPPNGYSSIEGEIPARPFTPPPGQATVSSSSRGHLNPGRDSMTTFTGAPVIHGELGSIPKPALRPSPGLSNTSVMNPTATARRALLEDVEELRTKEKDEEAAVECQRLLERSDLTGEERDWTLQMYAESLLNLGQDQEADKILDDLLKRSPKSHRALCAKGSVLLGLSRIGEARNYFAEALELSPESDRAITGLAQCALERENRNEAWDLLAKALSINPENRRAILTLAHLAREMDRLSEVENVLRSYLDYHPISFDVQCALAGVYLAQNRLDDALEQVERVRLFAPDHSGARELAALIQARAAAGSPGGTAAR